MIGGMIGHEARDGHAERDEAIERRVRAECAAEIKSTASRLHEVAIHCVNVELKNAEQAALIEQYQILIATFFHEYDQEVPHHGLLADALHNLRMFEPAVEEWRKK